MTLLEFNYQKSQPVTFDSIEISGEFKDTAKTNKISHRTEKLKH